MYCEDLAPLAVLYNFAMMDILLIGEVLAQVAASPVDLSVLSLHLNTENVTYNASPVANIKFPEEDLIDSEDHSQLEVPCNEASCEGYCRRRKHASGRCDKDQCVCRDFKQRGRCFMFGYGCGGMAMPCGSPMGCGGGMFGYGGPLMGNGGGGGMGMFGNGPGMGAGMYGYGGGGYGGGGYGGLAPGGMGGMGGMAVGGGIGGVGGGVGSHTMVINNQHDKNNVINDYANVH